MAEMDVEAHGFILESKAAQIAQQQAGLSSVKGAPLAIPSWHVKAAQLSAKSAKLAMECEKLLVAESESELQDYALSLSALIAYKVRANVVTLNCNKIAAAFVAASADIGHIRGAGAGSPLTPLALSISSEATILRENILLWFKAKGIVIKVAAPAFAVSLPGNPGEGPVVGSGGAGQGSKSALSDGEIIGACCAYSKKRGFTRPGGDHKAAQGIVYPKLKGFHNDGCTWVRILRLVDTKAQGAGYSTLADWAGWMKGTWHEEKVRARAWYEPVKKVRARQNGRDKNGRSRMGRGSRRYNEEIQ